MKAVKYALIGCGGLVVLAVGGLFLMIWAGLRADAAQYVPVEARVVAVEAGCKVGSDWPRPSERSTAFRGPRQVSEVQPCDAAGAAAGAGDARAFPAWRVTYAFVSPVDGREHRDAFDIERWHARGGYVTIRDGAWSYYREDRLDGPPGPPPGRLDVFDPRVGQTFGAEAHRREAGLARWRNDGVG